MNRVILIKYGELTTKKGNRNFFINTLYNNIKDKLKNYNVKISKDRSRMYIEFLDQELEQIKKQIDHIFGIHMYHIAYIVNTNLDDIKNTLLEVMKQETFKTFKIETKRSDKTFPYNSVELNPIFGTHLLKNIDNIDKKIDFRRVQNLKIYLDNNYKDLDKKENYKKTKKANTKPKK